MNYLKKFIKEYLKEGDTICLALFKGFDQVFDKSNRNRKILSKCTKFYNKRKTDLEERNTVTVNGCFFESGKS